LTKPGNLVVGENTLAITNSHEADELVDIFDSNGMLVDRLLHNGEGPDEALWIYKIQYCDKDKAFYTSDIFKHKVFKISGSVKDGFSAKQFLSLYKDENTLGDASREINITGHFGVMDNGQILASNGFSGGMWAIFDSNGHFIKTIIPFPDKNNVNDQLSEWANIELYKPRLSVSPDGKFAFAAYDSADMRTFFNIDGDSIGYNVCIDAYPNDLYIIDTGDGTILGALTMKSYCYALDQTASNNYAYELYIGMTLGDAYGLEVFKEIHQSVSKTVRVFDRKGKLKRILGLDRWVKTIAVTSDDKYLYALSESAQDGYTIVRYEL